MKRSQRGFNLVEVLVAMAITSVVIISVATLFVMGRRNVYSGKQTSAAVAVATRMTEDFSHMTRDEVYDKFGLQPAAGGGYAGESLVSGRKVEGITYDNCVLRTDADAGDANKDKGLLLQNWIALMLANNAFSNPHITIVFMPRLDTVAPKTDTDVPNKSTLLQIRAVLTWDETASAKRHRTLIVDAVKTKHT